MFTDGSGTASVAVDLAAWRKICHPGFSEKIIIFREGGITAVLSGLGSGAGDITGLWTGWSTRVCRPHTHNMAMIKGSTFNYQSTVLIYQGEINN